MGFLLVALGLTGALGQVFIFITIAKFGALTCSIIGLARKVTTLVASIWYFGHHINSIQFIGLAISVLSMVMDFFGKKKGGRGGHHGGGGHGGGGGNPADVLPPPPVLAPPLAPSDELQKILQYNELDNDDDDDIELADNSNNNKLSFQPNNTSNVKSTLV
jgi:UDP-galactose transporter B1